MENAWDIVGRHGSKKNTMQFSLGRYHRGRSQKRFTRESVLTQL